MTIEQLLKTLQLIDRAYVAQDEALTEVFRLELGRLATKHLKYVSPQQCAAIIEAAQREVPA